MSRRTSTPLAAAVHVDHVDRAVALVRRVMVDDDQLGGRLGARLEVAEPVECTAVECHEHLGLAVDELGWRQQLEAGQLAVVRRDDERRRERRDRVDARGAQHVVQRRASSRARRRRG